MMATLDAATVERAVKRLRPSEVAELRGLMTRYTALQADEPKGARYPSPLAWLTADPPLVMHPERGRTPFEPRDYQAAVLAGWMYPLRVIVKSRQIGITQTLALEAVYKVRDAGHPLALNVSYNEDQAQQFIRYCKDGVRAGDLVSDNTSRLEFRNGGRIVALPASQRAGRGYPASDIYLDEIAFAMWAEDIYAAISPAVANGGRITVSSSPNMVGDMLSLIWSGQFGPVTETVTAPEFRLPEPDGRWLRYDLPYDVLWGEGWAAGKRATMTREGFAREYMGEAGWEASGNSLFAKGDLDACFTANVRAPYEAGRRYRVYCDPAAGGADATVIHVWDVTAKPYRLVWHDRWVQAPFERLYSTVRAVAVEYHAQKARVEATGLGQTMPEELTNRMAGTGVTVEGWDVTAKSKAAALTAAQLLVEGHDVLFDVPEFYQEARMYQRDDRKLVQDEVMTFLSMSEDMFVPPATGVSLNPLSVLGTLSREKGRTP